MYFFSFPPVTLYFILMNPFIYGTLRREHGCIWVRACVLFIKVKLKICDEIILQNKRAEQCGVCKSKCSLFKCRPDNIQRVFPNVDFLMWLYTLSKTHFQLDTNTSTALTSLVSLCKYRSNATLYTCVDSQPGNRLDESWWPCSVDTVLFTARPDSWKYKSHFDIKHVFVELYRLVYVANRLFYWIWIFLYNSPWSFYSITFYYCHWSYSYQALYTPLFPVLKIRTSLTSSLLSTGPRPLKEEITY